jgi:hypothetical protein
LRILDIGNHQARHLGVGGQSIAAGRLLSLLIAAGILMLLA